MLLTDNPGHYFVDFVAVLDALQPLIRIIDGILLLSDHLISYKFYFPSLYLHKIVVFLQVDKVFLMFCLVPDYLADPEHPVPVVPDQHSRPLAHEPTINSCLHILHDAARVGFVGEFGEGGLDVLEDVGVDGLALQQALQELLLLPIEQLVVVRLG